jgi:Fur family ferric uptake transcriptional regulator
MRTVLRNEHPYGAGRSTAQRRLIAAAVPEYAFTVAELAEAVALKDPRVGLATVYRSVGALERSGWLTRVGEQAGTTLYARCEEQGHHHHAVCIECGRVEHTPCPIDGVSDPAAPAGFRVTSHALTLYGLCAACGSANVPPSSERR